MKKPSIVITGQVYIASEPKLKLWRQLAEFRKQVRRQSEELLKQWDKVDILREQKEGTVNTELEQLLGDIGAKVDELNETRTAGKLSIIQTAFGEIPLDELALVEVPVLFDLIDTWVSMLLSGKINELPNVEAPATK